MIKREKKLLPIYIPINLLKKKRKGEKKMTTVFVTVTLPSSHTEKSAIVLASKIAVEVSSREEIRHKAKELRKKMAEEFSSLLGGKDAPGKLAWGVYRDFSDKYAAECSENWDENFFVPR